MNFAEVLKLLADAQPYLSKLTPEEIAQALSAIETLIALVNKARS